LLGGGVIVDNEALIWFVLLNFLVIIVAVALKSKLKGTQWKVAMGIVAVTIVISGIVWRLLHGGF
jgi:hypothetical protein